MWNRVGLEGKKTERKQAAALAQRVLGHDSAIYLRAQVSQKQEKDEAEGEAQHAVGLVVNFRRIGGNHDDDALAQDEDDPELRALAGKRRGTGT